jgi:CheY-like chemotaxis protein
VSPATFRILVVDNSDNVHQKAVNELSKVAPTVVVRSAHNFEQASGLAEAEYFHLAFVDMKIGRDRGTTVMRHLNAVAPSCRMFVMTRHLEDLAAEILKHVGPTFSFSGLIDKVSGDTEWFWPFVEPVYTQWSRRILDVEGLGEVVEAILRKADRIDQQLKSISPGLIRLRRDPAALSDEIVSILMNLFGSIGQPVTDSRSLVHMRLLRSGFSSSVVVDALPSLRFSGLDQVVDGNRCVVKIGAKSEIRKEAERYEQVVKFGVAMDHRVELLGYAEGDALAGACYSFAGGNSSRIRTLDEMLNDPANPAWRPVVQSIFRPDASNWYSVRSEIRSLRDYFMSEQIYLDRCLDLLNEWVEGVTRLEAVKRSKQQLRIGDHLLTLPAKSMLAAPGLMSTVPACLVHGDLHGGNIVTDVAGRAYFIDYRNAGVGPRLIDIAALQATARFVDVEGYRRNGDPWPKHYDPDLVVAIAGSVRKEERIIQRRLSNGERWVEVVSVLDDARDDNFTDSTASEALWTYFAYCLSMYRFVHMEWYRKVRLLTWLSALTIELASET